MSSILCEIGTLEEVLGGSHGRDGHADMMRAGLRISVFAGVDERLSLVLGEWSMS